MTTQSSKTSANNGTIGSINLNKPSDNRSSGDYSYKNSFVTSTYTAKSSATKPETRKGDTYKVRNSSYIQTQLG